MEQTERKSRPLAGHALLFMTATSTYAASVLVLLPTWLLLSRKTPFLSPRGLVSFVLLAHTLYTLYQILLYPPLNIFEHYDLPLGASTQAIRDRLKGSNVHPQAMEQLVMRMGSFETRTLYVRFGHFVVSTCDHCHSYFDFALYATPAFLWSYTYGGIILGLATIRGTGKDRYRSLAFGALACMAIFEAYWIATVPITIPDPSKRPRQPLFMWYDNLWKLRQIAFLLLPSIIFFALPSPSSHPPMPITRHFTTLQNILTRIQLLRYTRGAIERTPDLRTQSQRYWDQRKREGAWVRNDEEVQNTARKVGLGFDTIRQGTEQDPDAIKVRKVAQAALQHLAPGFEPSPHWK